MLKIYLLLILFVLGAFCLENEEHEVKEKRIARASGKLGLGWSDWDSSNMWALVSAWDNDWTQTKWVYTWSVYPNTVATQAKVEFVPMLWGNRPNNGPGGFNDIAEFNKALANGVFNGRKAILAFNEPDRSDQSNIPVGTAVQLFRQYIQPLKSSKGLRLGAPAVASDQNGRNWLNSFMSQCSNCGIDFVPVHWYGSNPNEFKSYVTSIYNAFGKPIWVTEWACVGGNCGDVNYVYDFMGQTTQWLDQQSWVERFAWFGAMKNLGGYVPASNRLLSANGQSQSPLGLQYVQKGGHE